MNPALAVLLFIGVAGFIFIVWLTVAGLRQRWIEHQGVRSSRRDETILSLKVKRRNNFTDKLFRVELEAANKKDALPPFQPGQYLTLLVPQKGKKNRLRRSYSLASWQARPDVYELAIKKEESGKGSSWLFDALHEGVAIEAIRPKGSFVLLSTNAEIVLIAGGIGITPMRSMVHYLKSLPQSLHVKLFFASRFRSGLCYHEEFESLQQSHRWFQYYPILSQPDESWSGLTGRLNGGLIKQRLIDPKASHFYFCATTEMMDTIMKGLFDEGIGQHQCHFENFAVSSGHVSAGSFTISIEGYGDVLYEGERNIFQALENQDYPIQGDCRVGQCGLCKMRLDKGNVNWLTAPEAPCAPNEFLPCVCVPADNLEISGR